MKDEIPKLGQFDENTRTSTGGKMSYKSVIDQFNIDELVKERDKLREENERLRKRIKELEEKDADKFPLPGFNKFINP
jgi:regulator of replication initiation timing